MKIKMICCAVTFLLLATALAPAARAEEIDVRLLARAIENAARGESYTVMVSLGAVLLNRVRAESYPSSLAAVITDAEIDISECEPSSRALRAAADAAHGFDPMGGALRYKNGEYDGEIALATDSWCFY
jgi:N-acetylmuramoyl-L-alanine amidase